MPPSVDDDQRTKTAARRSHSPDRDFECLIIAKLSSNYGLVDASRSNESSEQHRVTLVCELVSAARGNVSGDRAVAACHHRSMKATPIRQSGNSSPLSASLHSLSVDFHQASCDDELLSRKQASVCANQDSVSRLQELTEGC
jgi:hypothetical protein